MKISSLTFPIRRVYYKLRFLKSIWNSYVAPWEWVDGYLEINMKLFEDFYNHSGLDTIMWSSDYDHCNARIIMEEIYEWWTITYKQREEEISYLLSLWNEHSISYWIDSADHEGCMKWKHQSTQYSEHVWNLLQTHEALFESEKKEMLEKLISIRVFLWT